MIEQSNGGARPTLPRSRDLSAHATAREPNRGRDTRGRFTGMDSPSNGRGWKSLIAKMAGRELTGEAAELGKASWRLYLALLSELPHDGPQVRALVAAQARSAIFAARYASRATELGLDTDAGRAALELSVRLDARAERLAVTSTDIADRMAKANTDRHRSAISALHARILNAPSASQGATPSDGGQP